MKVGVGVIGIIGIKIIMGFVVEKMTMTSVVENKLVIAGKTTVVVIEDKIVVGFL